ncbi:MAG: hypothetical protein IT270_08955 [Saprospiraceae bacterium]|nr:hypothetical protein [Saprospiraceae bacterium]
MPADRAQTFAHPAFFDELSQQSSFVFARLQGASHGVLMHADGRQLYCTCPFFPKPCWHARALELLYSQQPEIFNTTEGDLPPWVHALLSGKPASTLPNKAPSREAAQEQRRHERLDRAERGMEDLEVWINDTLRRGLATIVYENPGAIELIASRMADASLTGISRSLRLLAALPPGNPTWTESATKCIADLCLALHAFRRREHLNEAQATDLQTFLGIATPKEKVMQTGERIDDAWAVVGKTEETLEKQLSVRRTWLLGGRTLRQAVLIDYAFGGVYEPTPEVGSIVQAPLAFYPSAYPLRALPAQEFKILPKKVEKLPGFVSIQSFAKAYAEALGQNPWLSHFPATFPVLSFAAGKNGKFFVYDEAGDALPLRCTEDEGWRFMAQTGGKPACLASVWDGQTLKCLLVV